MASSVNNVMEEETVIKDAAAKNLPKNVLDLFWKLASTDSNTRRNACSSMIWALASKQEVFEVSNGKGKKCQELDYAMDRLVRGLASSRQAARQGYCLVLSEVLRLFPAVDVEDVLQLIEKNLPTNVKQDKCQMVIGQTMGYNALAMSSRLASSPHLPLAVMNFYHLTSSRSFLQPAAYHFMQRVLSELDEKTFKETLWPHLKSELKQGWDKVTPQVLAWLLLIVRTFPGAIGQKFFEKHWGCENFLEEANLDHWKAVIKQATTVHPEVHPVCLEFLELLVKSKSWKHIWIHVIDENLFELDQNERAFLGFNLVKEMLKKVNKKKLVKHVISPKFSAVFSRSYIHQKSPLNSAAVELASFLCQYVKDTSDPDIQMFILQVFLQQTGKTFLQQMMKKKEVVLIMSYLCSDAVKSFFNHLKSIIFQEQKDSNEDEAGHKQHQAVVQMGTLISHPQIVADNEWRLSVLKFLFLHSHFSVVKKYKEDEETTDSFPESLRKTFLISFTKALNSMTPKAKSGTLEVLQSIADYAEELLGEKEIFKPLFPVEKFQHPWSRLRRLLKKLKKHVVKDTAKTDECLAFQILLLHLGLHLFGDTKFIPKTLEELDVCCRNCLKFSASADESSSAAEDVDEGPPWIQVLVDILLSLMSQGSHHMRRITCSVFPMFCPFITGPALQLIFDVINPAGSDEPALEEDDDDEDVEFVSGSSESEEEDGEDAKMKDKNVNADFDSEFKENLQKALGSAAASGSEDSDVVLSDSDMFKLDEAISKAFLSRRKGGPEQRKAEQRTLADFRNRCLDLIMLYLKSEPPLNMVLKCVKPLLTACNEGASANKKPEFVKKATSVIAQIPKTKKFQNMEGVEVSELEDLFKYLLERIHKESRTDVFKVTSSLLVFLVCCERKLRAKSGEDPVASELLCLKAYLTGLDEFINHGNTHMQPQTFLSLLHACPEYAWLFVKPLEKYAFREKVRLFRRTQCLGLIVAALNFSKAQKSVTVDMWTSRAESIVKKTVEALKTVFSNEDIKPTYTSELLDVLITIHTILRNKKATPIVQNYPGLLDMLISLNHAQCKMLKKKGIQLHRQLITSLGGKIPSKYGPYKSEHQDELKDAECHVAKRIKTESENAHESGECQEESSDDDEEDDHEAIQTNKVSSQPSKLVGVNGDVNMSDSDSESDTDDS